MKTINGDSRLALLVLAPALLLVFLGTIQVALYVEELDSWLVRGIAAVGCLVGAGLYGLAFPMTTPLFAAGVGPTPRTLMTVTRWSPVVVLLLAGSFLLRFTMVLTPE